jgi:hypothetical protein
MQKKEETKKIWPLTIKIVDVYLRRAVAMQKSSCWCNDQLVAQIYGKLSTEVRKISWGSFVGRDLFFLPESPHVSV